MADQQKQPTEPPKMYKFTSIDRENRTATVGEEVPLNTQSLRFQKACENVLRGELEAFADAFRSFDQPVPTEQALRQTVAQLHWTNPICGGCHNRRITKLYLCKNCYLHWYCSEVCEEKHWTTGGHSTVCCKPDAPYDRNNDPYRPAFLRAT